jgi:hypothetical protein
VSILDAAVHVKENPNKMMKDIRLIHWHDKMCIVSDSSHCAMQYELHINKTLLILNDFNIRVITNP